MKPSIYKFKLILYLIVPVLFLFSCASRPSDAEVKEAIKAKFKKGVPMMYAGSFAGGSNANIEIIEVKERGKYSKDGKYWPVKARVKGTCYPWMVRERKSFDRVGEFTISQDDYGNWYAN